MRAIIIEEDRFVDFTNTLKLEHHKLQESNTAERLSIPANVWKIAIDEAHRSYHYHFVKWAQSHGASCVRN